MALHDSEPERNRFRAGNRTHAERVRVGREKVTDDDILRTMHRYKTVERTMNMEQVVMKHIMRLVVAGSLVAIAVNIVMMFG